MLWTIVTGRWMRGQFLTSFWNESNVYQATLKPKDLFILIYMYIFFFFFLCVIFYISKNNHPARWEKHVLLMHYSILQTNTPLYFQQGRLVKYAFSLCKINMLQDIKAGDCDRLVMSQNKKCQCSANHVEVIECSSTSINIDPHCQVSISLAKWSLVLISVCMVLTVKEVFISFSLSHKGFKINKEMLVR